MQLLRRVFELVRVALWAWVSLGCGELPQTGVGGGVPDEAPDAAASASVSVDVQPMSDGEAFPVLRIRVSGGSGDPAQLLLFDGELSSYHLGRIEDRELTSTLLERLVPSVNWATSSGERWLAPTQVLSPGQRYSATFGAIGLLSTFVVQTQPEVVLGRVWPPPDQPCAATHVVFCGASAPAGTGAEPIQLDPAEIAGSAGPGAHATGFARDHCMHVATDVAPAEGAVFVPPPTLLGLPVEPGVIRHTAARPSPIAACASGETSFGPGCASVLDDRVTLRSPATPVLWLIAHDAEQTVQAAPPNGVFVLGGLAPDAEHRFEVRSLDVSGSWAEASVVLRTLPARPHVVLNEALADAAGAEPAQEWIELYNDGSLATDLAGWSLSDSGGTTLLPSFVLAPSAFALVVRDDFQPLGTGDVPVAAGTPLLRVPQLGKNGLANAGEALSLASADGVVQSRLPAAPKPKSGVSVARRRPSAPDADPNAFGLHADPGASPGAPNVLR
jgi:hypothetical protein